MASHTPDGVPIGEAVASTLAEQRQLTGGDAWLLMPHATYEALKRAARELPLPTIVLCALLPPDTVYAIDPATFDFAGLRLPNA